MSENKFNLDQFRKWMRTDKKTHTIERPPIQEDDLVGTYVVSKVDVEKLMEKMEIEGEDAEDIANEFADDGGEIISTADKMFEIQVPSGNTFSIVRYYVKRG